MFRPATLKLTLWYVLLAACLCALFSIIMYHLSTEEYGEALRQQYSRFISSDHDQDNVVSPDESIDEHGQHLLGELLWLNAAVIAGSSILGYLLARRTLEPLERAHQVQVRFTAEASHELRTPLAAMRADTEATLMEEGLAPKAQRVLRDNLRDIAHLEVLTNQLLDLARYQNRATMQHVLLNLGDITQQAADRLKHAAHEKQVRINRDIQPALVMGEQHGLQQLVTIVLDNAIKYSKQRGTVTLSLRTSKTAALLIVKDEGIGIPAADLTHVFERFYRSANTRTSTPAADGYGLGLPLAQEIVRAHGGTIRIQSEHGGGTTVHIVLPLAHK